MSSSSNVVPFPSSETNPWVEEYQQACLTAHDPGTIRVYRQILQQFTQWVGTRTGKAGRFSPEQITTIHLLIVVRCLHTSDLLCAC